MYTRKTLIINKNQNKKGYLIALWAWEANWGDFSMAKQEFDAHKKVTNANSNSDNDNKLLPVLADNSLGDWLSILLVPSLLRLGRFGRTNCKQRRKRQQNGHVYA